MPTDLIEKEHLRNLQSVFNAALPNNSRLADNITGIILWIMISFFSGNALAGRAEGNGFADS